MQVLGAEFSLAVRWAHVFKRVEAHQDITEAGGVGEC